MKKLISAIAAGLLFVSASSTISKAGSWDVGVYGGVGVTLDSDVTYTAPGGGTSTSTDVEWDGDSFGPAPYWGARITYWPETMPRWGFMLDYTHAKMIADNNSGGANPVGTNYNQLEFTDGLNLITANVLYKYDEWARIKPYAGAGIGLSIPHVEVERIGGNNDTREYQVTGVAVQALLGAEVDLGNNFALFGEYKFSYAQIDADLAGAGGSLETDAWTNHFVLGLTYKFGEREKRRSWK